MPHDRLRFAWILPPRAVWLPRRSVRQEQQPKAKGASNNASPCEITSDIGRTRALYRHKVAREGQKSNLFKPNHRSLKALGRGKFIIPSDPLRHGGALPLPPGRTPCPMTRLARVARAPLNLRRI